MAMSCVLCEQRSEDTEEISFHAFPEDEDRRRKWLDAIGKTDTEVSVQSLLCSRHFPPSCFAGSTLADNAVPTLIKLAPHSSDSIAEFEETDQSEESEESDDDSYPPTWPGPLPWPVTRPTISRGRRVHMLSEEEMKARPTFKYIRSLKNINWDEISKVPEEAKIAWEVAMEELKENNDEIKKLQARVLQFNTTVVQLKAHLNALKNAKRSRR